MTYDNYTNKGLPLHTWKSSQYLSQLPATSCEELVPAHARAVVIAPHPDDEVLGCGGIMQLLARRKRQLMLISVTNGSASHRGPQLWTKERLGVIRPQESAEALRRLGMPMNELQWIHGGFPDMEIGRHAAELKHFFRTYLRPTDVIFTPWQGDGHPDHETVARAAIAAAAEIGATVHEVPIWTWQWASEEDPRIPWRRAYRIPLDKWTQARKRHAIQAFASQLTGDPGADHPPALAPALLERLQQAFEIVFV